MSNKYCTIESVLRPYNVISTNTEVAYERPRDGRDISSKTHLVSADRMLEERSELIILISESSCFVEYVHSKLSKQDCSTMNTYQVRKVTAAAAKKYFNY